MRVVFVYGGYDSLGIEYLSAVLKRSGVEVALAFDPRLFDDHYSSFPLLARQFNRSERVANRVLELEPDLVAFSVVTDDYRWACRLARLIKDKRDVPVVFGGIHPTSVPERVIRKPFVDYVVTGEGEGAILDLVQALESGESPAGMPNLWLKHNGEVLSAPPRPLIESLDSLPFPDKSLFYDEMPFLKYEYRTITSRGCPYNCTYCLNNFLKRLYKGKGTYLRRRSVSNVIEELCLAKELYRPRMIQFYDDVFTAHPEWLEEFAPLYIKEVSLPFWCSANPLTLTPGVVGLLKQMGCVEVQLGVQTAVQRLRREVLHRPGSTEANLQAIRLVREAGIKCVADNISGLPTETEEDLLTSVRFYITAKPSRISDYYLRYYPRTEIVEIARKAGALRDEKIDRIEEGGESGSFALGGTQNPYSKDPRLHSFLQLIPLLPRSLSRFLLRTRLYRFIPRTTFLFRSLRRMVDVAMNRDINARRYFRRYIYYLLRR